MRPPTLTPVVSEEGCPVLERVAQFSRSEEAVQLFMALADDVAATTLID